MPKENMKRGRGRREEKKRKNNDDSEPRAKRQKAHIHDKNADRNAANPGSTKSKTEFGVEGELGDDFIAFGDMPAEDKDNGDAVNEIANDDGDYAEGDSEQPGQEFFGLLDPSEQEYFSRASSMLEANDFPTPEDKALFVQSVFAEAKGKELKIACSQSCSRLMERLIAAAGRNQVRRLLKAFKGHFVGLVCHRFASHVVEGLVTKGGKIIAGEVGPEELEDVAPAANSEDEEMTGMEEVEEDETLEKYILDAAAELEPHLGYLLTERFASHTIRVFLLVLAGEPVEESSNIVASRRKEKAAKNNEPKQELSKKQPVPESFTQALAKMIKDSVSGLDSTYLRALATSPTGNPVLQLLLSLELTHFGKTKAKDEHSVLRKLIPDDTLEEGSDSAIFVRGLLFDPVGSRLLETIVKHAPGKTFKALYKNFFEERMGSLARNEIAGFVAIRVLERLSKEDLEKAVALTLPEFQSLVDRSRLAVIRSLIERCIARGLETKSIAEALKKAYGGEPGDRLIRMLKFEEQTEEQKAQPGPKQRSPEAVHGSLLAQTMLSTPGQLSAMIYESLNALSPTTILSLSKDPSASRVVQEALTCSTTTAQFRRSFIPRFFGHIVELAQHGAGSHVADVLWTATADLTFMKERFAEELLKDEAVLRESFFGRTVWRNWNMDRYKRSRRDWMAQIKTAQFENAAPTVAPGAGRFANKQAVPQANGKQIKKSGIELARERFAHKKAQQEHKKNSKGTSANSIMLGTPAVKTADASESA